MAARPELTEPRRSGIEGMVPNGSGITAAELRRVAEARTAGERRIRLTFDSSPIGMALEGLDGRFLEVNPALCQMLGRGSEWLLAHRVADVLDREELGPDLVTRDQIASGLIESSSLERRLVRSDGSRVWALQALGLLTDERGAPQQFVAHYADITEVRSARERMRHMATHDGLTGLLNREGFWASAATVLGHPGRAGTGVAVLFLDLDDFKAVNDSLGHAGGDRVLTEIGARIRGCLRTDDLVARLGGDEFVALLTAVSEPADAAVVAGQLHRCVSEPIVIDGGEVRVTLSIGMTLVRPDDLADAALHRADLSMYRAKAAGGGRTMLG